MNDRQRLQTCIDSCNNSMSEINSMKQNVKSSNIKDELNRVSQAISDCISHCQNAVKSL